MVADGKRSGIAVAVDAIRTVHDPIGSTKNGGRIVESCEGVGGLERRDMKKTASGWARTKEPQRRWKRG
jgi:hypothetical protein